MSEVRASLARPSFDEVFNRVRGAENVSVTSRGGTAYRVTALVSSDGVETLVARPRSRSIRIHEDCWGAGKTCQGTWAGGVYNGSPSLYDWFGKLD